MSRFCFRRILVFFFIFVAGFTTSIISVEAVDEPAKVNYLLPDYFCDLESTENLEDIFDYSFEGIVKGIETVSQYNGNGTDIPYTYYKVKVTKELKGELEDEVIIKYYGGYNEEGELVLLENAELPEIGEKYTFYCNQTKLNYRSDERTIAGSYVISNPECMIRGKVVPKRKKLEVNESISFPKLSAAPKYHSLLELERSILSSTGNPFEDALGLYLGYTYSVYLNGGEPMYYRATRNTLDYIAIYSTGSTDVTVSVYDENYNLIGSNDDVGSSRGRMYTSGYNFYYHYYADANKTYYFKVSTYSSYASGPTTIRIIIDNFYLSQYSQLVTSSDAVDKGKKIHYTHETYYPTSIANSAAEWNKLGTVLILPDTSSTTNDVTIKQYNDSDAGIVAYTNKHWLWGWRIFYNNHYFLSMTMDQKQKTIMHEFGHTLGLGEFCSKDYCESNDNVMVQGIRSLTKLGPADIAVYRQKWG